MNPVALVTGASRGIGAATAKLLADSGYRLCINYRRDHTAAERIVQYVRDAGSEAMAVQADVAHEDQVLRLFNALDERFGQIDLLVNNAGIVRPQQRFEQITEDRIQEIFSVNVFGTLLCAREAVKRMVKLGGGCIVNVSSAASRTGSPNEYVDYAASKGAIDTLTIGLAKEVATQGIRVNAVRPGFIETDMHSDGGEAERVKRLSAMIPAGRGGLPEEVARTIVWLASAEASFTHGSIVDVAGGV